METRRKIFILIGFIGIALGGFALTKYLTRNVRRVRGGTITLQKFTEPPIEEPLT